jgi:Putative Ig domain/Subtilase family
VRIALLTRQAVAVAAAAGLGVLGITAPAIASATAQHPGARPAPVNHSFARPALPAGQHYACPAAGPGQMTCMSIVPSRLWRPASATVNSPAVVGAYFPNELRSAYKLAGASANRGKGKTIAIVDAFNNPHAGSDLGKYRRIFNLPPCTKANGCLRIVNQKGNASPLPNARVDWGVEISLDLDMVSAICPKCHILLVEANNALTSNLGAAVNTAVRKGAKFVSNSWGGPEFGGQNRFSRFFNHPGRVIAFASGDAGFGPTFPADLQFVTSVGGTRLVKHSGGRGWSESVWGVSAPHQPGTASGCSNGEAKPSWQLVDFKSSGGCLTRTENDVAAVADPATGVAVYDSFGTPDPHIAVGGTSAATPIITAAYALAGSPKTRTYPAQYPYLRSGHFFDVTTGANGTCDPNRQYLCNGEPRYDGPTGLGTPNGIVGLGVGAARMVTVVDPGRRVGTHGHSFSVKIIGLDSANVSLLHYNGNGTLPSGLSIKSIPHSTNGIISGTIHASPGTYPITVSATDGTAKGTTHFMIVVQ